MKKLLRSILKILGYAIVVFVVDICLMGISKTLFGYWIEKLVPNGGELLHEGFFMLLSIVIVNFFISYFLKSEEVKSGWPKFKISFTGFLNGSLLGLVTATAMLILTILLGGGKLTVHNFEMAAYIIAAAPLLGILLIAALSEEWLFRGYPLTILSNVTGRFWAVMVFAILFSLAHLSSNGMNWIVFFNIIIGGAIVGIMRFTKGGIPMAWGFHFAWNSAIALAGATLSGIPLYIPGVRFISKGQLLLSGGELGPEGGIGATFITLLLLLLIGVYFWKNNNSNLNPLPIKLFKSKKYSKNHSL